MQRTKSKFYDHEAPSLFVEDLYPCLFGACLSACEGKRFQGRLKSPFLLFRPEKAPGLFQALEFESAVHTTNSLAECQEDFFRRAAVLPPFLPPFLLDDLFSFFPRPEPLFLPPPEVLLTVAQARLLAVFLETPFFS